MTTTEFADNFLEAREAMDDKFGRSIVYQRGASSATITATFSRSELVTETTEGTRLDHTDRDFIFPAASLVLAGVAVTPQKGDRVTVGEEVFEVLPIDGKQCYRTSDPQGTMIRVFAKKID